MTSTVNFIQEHGILPVIYISMEYVHNTHEIDRNRFIMVNEITDHLYIEGISHEVMPIKRDGLLFQKMISIKNEKFDKINDCIGGSIENLHKYLNISAN